MRVPLSWLRAWAPVDASGAEVAAALVRAGLEVEKVESVGADVHGVVVGEVRTVAKVEGSDKLSFVEVAVDPDPSAPVRGIVCGASNYAVGDRVPVALPGAELPGGFQIAQRKVFGTVSDGMLCSARELGLFEDHSGILLLGRGSDAPDVGADFVEISGLRDEVLDIAVTPDRGYCLAVRGVAREAATAFGVPFADVAQPAVSSSDHAGQAVVVEDEEACPRYVARVVRGVDPTATSPLWLRRRLALAGMRPISLAVDITNHVMLDLGAPLHAFDLDQVDGAVVVRRAREGERLTTLDGVDRALHPEDLLIADAQGPLGLAGLMGGARSEISAATRDVLVEAAHFAPVVVGRSSRRHGLSSEAGRRFERGVDPALPPAAAEAVVALLVELGGGVADVGVTDLDARSTIAPIPLRLSAPGRVAGRDYAESVVRTRLTEVGCSVEGADPLQVTPPSWRPDLRLEVDLVEEVVRLEGYDSIPSVLPAAPAGRGLTELQRARRSVGRALAAQGLVEVTSYPFVGETALDALGLPADDDRRALRRLANPLSEEAAALRPTLLVGLLDALVRNVGRGVGDVALFEVGAVFSQRGARVAAPRTPVTGPPDAAAAGALDAARPHEEPHVAAVLAGELERSGWWGSGRPADWADAVELARCVAVALRAEVTVRAGDRAPWHPGRCAELLVDDVSVGWAGELHPRVIAARSLPARTCAFELSLLPLLAARCEVVAAPRLVSYPPAVLDVALVVDEGVPAAAVEAALRAGAGDLLEDLRLFDVYRGAQVGDGRKSLAYALRLRSATGTLTDVEALAVRDAAVAIAADRLGAVLRGA